MAHFSINAQSTAWLKRLAIFLGVFAFMVLSACGGGFSVVTSPDTLPPSLVTSPNTPSPSVDVSPNPLTPGVSQAALSIKVENLDGSAIAAVNILSSTGVAAATDAQGQAQINLSIGQDITLALTKTGVANQVKVLRIPAGSASVQLRVTMLAREAAQTLADIGAGGMVQGKDGALASFPAGSLVDANGNVVTGAVQMQLTPVNVLADAAAFPGVFAGTQGAAAPMGIVSYGTAEFHPTQGGQKLQVAPGKTVTIEIPMYATKNPNGSAVLLGQVIPLWSLNEATGIWKQEGTGTVVANAGSPTGLALRANVSHFSWWNCDDITGPEALVDVKCMLLDASGNPTVAMAAGQTCTVRGEVSEASRRPAQRAEDVAGPDGLMALRIPAGVEVQLFGQSQSAGVVLRGMTAVNLPAGSRTSVIIALASPVETVLVAPARGASLAQSAQATAQVASAVDKVELYLGGIKVAESTAAPYVFNFSTQAAPEGFSTLQARSIRGTTAVGTSELRSVIIDRSPPILTLTRLNAAAGNGLVELRALVQDLSPIAKVEFFKGTVKIGEDTSFPFEHTYTLQAGDAAVVSFTARAADPLGQEGVSNAITFGTQALSVTLALSPPVNPITSSQAIALAATASSSNGIARVEFFKGSTKIGEDSSAPYELSHFLTGADVPQAAFMARAVDNAGNVATAQQSVAVNISSSDTVPPSIALDALDALASPITQGAVLLAATATDNVGVAKVEFYLNGVLRGERTAPETGKYRFQVDVSLLQGLTTFAAVAYDAAGNTAQSSQTATVNIAVAPLSTLDIDLSHMQRCQPSMGIAADGTIYVVHMARARAEIDSQFDAQVSKRVGGAWQSLGFVNDPNTSHVPSNVCPTIAVTAAGQPYVALRTFAGRGFAQGVGSLQVRRLTAQNIWETVRDIIPTNANDKIQITIDNLSRPIITWSGFVSSGFHRLNVERFDGVAWQILASQFGSLDSGNMMGHWRTAVRPDNSLAVAMSPSLGPFGGAIIAFNVTDAGAAALGNSTTRIIAQVGDTTAGVSPADIAVTADETVVSYRFFNSSGFNEIRTVAFNTSSNTWALLGAASDQISGTNVVSGEASLAFQGGSLVQVVLQERLISTMTQARRWNGVSWSAMTSLAPINSALSANLHVFNNQLFMVYAHSTGCCGPSTAAVALLRVP